MEAKAVVKLVVMVSQQRMKPRRLKGKPNRDQTGAKVVPKVIPKTMNGVPLWSQISQQFVKMEYKTANRASRGTPCEKTRKKDANLFVFWIPFWSKIN